MNIIVGTVIYPHGAYILDKFIANQQEIQNLYPNCELIFATADSDFASFLKDLMKSSGLKGTVLIYEIIKPSYARSIWWNVACGREILRKYVLANTEANYLHFMDADMIFDPHVLEIMEREIQGYDIVFSGYPLRNHGVGLAGCGCMLLSRNILEQITIRCLEFKNGEVIFEDNLIELDAFRAKRRIKKGFFVTISHYTSKTEFKRITPRPVDSIRRITEFSFRQVLLN